MTQRRMPRAAEASPHTGMIGDLPEWRTSWPLTLKDGECLKENPNCFFCFEGTPHSKEACIDHATMSQRDMVIHPTNKTKMKQIEAAERRERCYKSFIYLLKTKNMRPADAIRQVAEKENISCPVVETYIRIRRPKSERIKK